MNDKQPDRQVHIAHDDDTERLRQWWKRNGLGIIAGVVLGIGGVAGIQRWRIYENVQREKAPALYEEMLAAAASGDQASLKGSAEALLGSHSNSGYADLAQLILARQAFESGDVSAAENALTEIIETSADPVMQQVARVRLAVLALQAGDVERIKALAEAQSTEGFVSQFQELLGDALVASGELEAAARAYEKALSNVAANSQAAQLLNAKLNMTRQDTDAG